MRLPLLHFLTSRMCPDSRMWARLAEVPAVLVRVSAARGSVPREVGAWMAVSAQEVFGTIGGGHLEWQAIAAARACLAEGGEQERVVTTALGPSLGQCCGGQVSLSYRRLGAADLAPLRDQWLAALAPVALFGGGHVGRAIVAALSPLPFSVHWIDSRDEVFPDGLPPQVRAEHSDPVQGAVAGLAAGARVLIMSFSHAEDLDIVAACLRRQREHRDLPFVGLIGSRTKWGTFRHRLLARGFTEAELAHITCPIGLPGIEGKQPSVIAASVAAQLLLDLSENHPPSA